MGLISRQDFLKETENIIQEHSKTQVINKTRLRLYKKSKKRSVQRLSKIVRKATRKSKKSK